MLECDYCAGKFTIEEIEAQYSEKNEIAAEQFEKTKDSEWDTSELNTQWQSQEIKTYICPSCAAELICDESTAASRCPYCGNPTVIPGQFKGTLQPDFVLPFKLSQQDAIQALNKYYKGKKFLPDSFKDKNVIKEVQGVYVPFWLFDGKAHVNVMYDATRSHTITQGQYRLTHTDHFDVHRVGSISFEKIPVDSSKNMPDEIMDAIEPFDYRELKPFSHGYLPGFLAERYSYEVSDCMERADLRIQNSSVIAMREDVHGYEGCVEKFKDIRIERGKVYYALMPVYLLSTRFNNSSYLFAMNGQTGKMIGNLPIDQKKYWMTFAAVFAAVCAAAGTVLLMLL